MCNSLATKVLGTDATENLCNQINKRRTFDSPASEAQICNN